MPLDAGGLVPAAPLPKDLFRCHHLLQSRGTVPSAPQGDPVDGLAGGPVCRVLTAPGGAQGLLSQTESFGTSSPTEAKEREFSYRSRPVASIVQRVGQIKFSGITIGGSAPVQYGAQQLPASLRKNLGLLEDSQRLLESPLQGEPLPKCEQRPTGFQFINVLGAA